MKHPLTTCLNRLSVLTGAVITVTTACLAGTPALAGDVEFKPSVTASEEVNDNIFEVSGNKRTEFITRLQPGFTFRYQAPAWDWDVGYTFDYRHYAKNSRTDEFNHDANVRGNIVLVKDFMFVDLTEAYHRVTTDVSRTAAVESSLFLNQTDQNTAAVSPYLLWRLGEKDTLKTGYRYREVRYKGVGIETFEHGATADLSHEISSKFSLSAGYAFTYLDSQPSRYTKHDFSGGFRYEYADRSFVFGQVGNSWQNFIHGSSKDYIFWNAGVTHDFNFAVATVETRVQTATDPLAVSTKETSYSGRLEKTLPRGGFGLSASYTEFADTENSNRNRERLSFSVNGRYEVLQDLTVNLGATAERFYVPQGFDFRYHLNAIGGMSYAFVRDLSLSLNYSYAIRCNELGSTAGAIEVNRGIVEIRKSF